MTRRLLKLVKRGSVPLKELSSDFLVNVRELDTVLGVGKNYDLVSRYLRIGGRTARMWTVDGYSSDNVTERISSFLLRVSETDMLRMERMQTFVDRFVTFTETNVEFQLEKMVTGVMQGKTLLLVEGLAGGALMDAKSYPARSVDEPDGNKVLRGAHDGFVETLVQNTALLRRRVRDPNLMMEAHRVGKRSRTDVVICYLASKVNPEQLEEVRRKVDAVDVNSLSMGQESLAEAMMTRQWWNPFPKVRYTERPDVATATVMEGNILILVDNTPAVMLLPTNFFHFWQGINEYYFPPLVGTYFRFVRLLVQITLLTTPLWYLAARGGAAWLPESLRFLEVDLNGTIPLYWQIISMEIIVDILKLAALNTPNSISASFSMLGALILGEFAVTIHWVVPEVLIYLAFAAIANSVQPSYEMGYAVKLSRMFLVTLSMALDLWGLALGLVILFVVLLTTKPIIGKSYLYPLIPFNKHDLVSFLYRRPISKRNT
jgi:stage V sporulation protein AF